MVPLILGNKEIPLCLTLPAAEDTKQLFDKKLAHVSRLLQVGMRASAAFEGLGFRFRG